MKPCAYCRRTHPRSVSCNRFQSRPAARCKIGDRASAHARILDFVARVHEYSGRLPQTVVVFSEDYDVLDFRTFARKPYRVTRGPSVKEYDSATVAGWT